MEKPYTKAKQYLMNTKLTTSSVHLQGYTPSTKHSSPVIQQEQSNGSDLRREESSMITDKIEALRNSLRIIFIAIGGAVFIGGLIFLVILMDDFFGI